MAIAKCNNPSCVNEFQDATYGKNMRVMNEDSKGGLSCTACGRNTRGEGNKKKK